MPPFSLALLKSAIIKNGHQAECLDLNYQAWHLIKKPLFWEKNSLSFWTNEELFAQHLQADLQSLIQDWATEIIERPAQAIGFSCYESNYRCTNLLINALRQRGYQKKIIVGGPLCFCKETRIKISELADYVQIGEGEEAITEWLNYLEKGGGSLPNSVYKRSFIKNHYQEFPLRKISSLENYAHADFSDFVIANYETKALPCFASRGCLFSCAFCADSPFSRPFRKISSKILQENLQNIYKKGYRLLWFSDLLINGIINELTTAFRRLLENGRKIEWTAMATPDPKLSPSILQELASIGCISLNLGLESGSDHILSLMNKGFNRAIAKESIKNIFQAGVYVQLNLMVGFPGESEDDFQQTISLLQELRPYINGFTSVNTCIVLPGSHIFAHKEKYGIEFPPSQDPTQWHIANTNTPEIRAKRMRVLQDWISQAGLTTWNSNYLSVSTKT